MLIQNPLSRYRRDLDSSPDECPQAVPRHEAGHALMAALFGYPLVEAYVYDYHGAARAGGCVNYHAHRFGLLPWDPNQARVIELAGPVAELLSGGSFVALARHRLELAHDRCYWPAGYPWHARMAALAVEQDHVTHLLREHWRAVVALADLLIAERFVVGRRLCAVIMDSVGLSGALVPSARTEYAGRFRWVPDEPDPRTVRLSAGTWIRTDALGYPFRDSSSPALPARRSA